MISMDRVLHIIPTPIGNLEDITLRSIRLLKESDLIFAEDTRTTKKLLSQYKIDTKMISYHNYNEHKILNIIIKKILKGTQCSLVSDAGTPGISDPGFLLIRECIKNNIKVICLPGPTACIPALIQSGFPCEKFYFHGFLPLKKGRKKALKEIAQKKYPSIIYESKHRIIKTLDELSKIDPKREAAILKELTKVHENTYRDTIGNLLKKMSALKLKGEFIIILNGEK